PQRELPQRALVLQAPVAVAETSPRAARRGTPPRGRAPLTPLPGVVPAQTSRRAATREAPPRRRAQLRPLTRVALAAPEVAAAVSQASVARRTRLRSARLLRWLWLPEP